MFHFDYFLCCAEGYLCDYLHFLIFFQEYLVKTGCGPVSVLVCGDPDKPALVTYPDLALNRKHIKCYAYQLLETSIFDPFDTDIAVYSFAAAQRVIHQ